MRTRPIQSSSDPVSSPLEGAEGKGHRSVLLHEAIEQLHIAPEDIVLDATLGGAGHARALAERLSEKGTLVGFDLDADAIQRSREKLAGVKPEIHLVQANFRDLTTELSTLGIARITKALFDLGMSSYQLNVDSGLPAEASACASSHADRSAQAGRGFSFLRDEPLLMTYSSSGEHGLTASVIVNEWAESSLADIIFGWGEERYARRIAKAIVESRTKKHIHTSRELAEIVKASVPMKYRYGRIHPATRTFQALRIAVNDELGALTEGLAGAWGMLAPRGRVAVIAFHSIEDRIVKRLFAGWERSGAGKRMTKKPITPSREEIAENPRARSAKLRVISKIV